MPGILAAAQEYLGVGKSAEKPFDMPSAFVAAIKKKHAQQMRMSQRLSMHAYSLILFLRVHPGGMAHPDGKAASCRQA
jgi:hypothetical protein